MDNRQIATVIRRLRKAVAQWRTPAVTVIGRKRDPFRVLVSCILSLRTRDEVTEAASARLFALADTPQGLLALSPKVLEKSIYPVGFYRNKTRNLRSLCRDLLAKHQGRVPDSMVELLTLKGVGRKTANLTLTLGFNSPGLCVDIHVHRISNRWGYVCTRSPDATEMALRQKLAEKYWQEFNNLLVTFGQNRCKPVSPLCTECNIEEYCQKVGVGKYR